MAVKIPAGWIHKIPINLATLFALYPYHALANPSGDATISATTTIATTRNGPIQVAKFRNLTINAPLTGSDPCRGLFTFQDTLTLGASGHSHMDFKCPFGTSAWVNQDIVIPSYIVLSGNKTSLSDFLAWIRRTGYLILDPNLYVDRPAGMGDVMADYTSWPSRGTAIVSAAGCGAAVVTFPQSAYCNGTAGVAGINAPGSGGGPATYNNHAISGRGNVWGGGSGANPGWSGAAQLDQTQHGGGVDVTTAYGPGGSPGGGLLVHLTRGMVTFIAGHAITSTGTNGGIAGTVGGGGAAGGLVAVISESVAGTPNMAATGGAAPNTSYLGGPGGAGTASSKTLAQMGLS